MNLDMANIMRLARRTSGELTRLDSCIMKEQVFMEVGATDSD